MRLASAASGIPLILWIDHSGGLLFGATLTLAALVGTAEMYRLLRHAQFRPLVLPGLAASAALALLPSVTPQPQNGWLAIVAALVLLAGSIFLRPEASGALVNWSLTLLPVLSVGLLLGFLGLLRVGPDGAWWVAAVLVITWAYDSAAYVTGRLVGKRPFMAHISPKKTREGVMGGLLAAGVAGLITVPAVHLSVGQALLFGVMLGAAAQAGDLVESLIKRQTGVKDSGVLIPGHGGLLDRIDSLLFAGAVAYYLALVMGHAT